MKLKIIIGIIIFVLLTGTLYGVYRHFIPKKIEVVNTVEIPVPKIIEKKVPKIIKKIEYIKVYEKESLNSVVTLPNEAIDKDKEVIAVGNIRCKKSDMQIMAVLNTKTGDAKLINQEIKKLFRFEGDISMYVEGKIVGSTDAPIGRLGVIADIVRINRDVVVYVKGETGLFDNTYKSYYSTYAGIKYEF